MSDDLPLTPAAVLCEDAEEAGSKVRAVIQPGPREGADPEGHMATECPKSCEGLKEEGIQCPSVGRSPGVLLPSADLGWVVSTGQSVLRSPGAHGILMLQSLGV